MELAWTRSSSNPLWAPNFQLVILSEPLFCLAKDLGAPREASAFFADA